MPIFESGPVRPLALSPSRHLLLALNTPDNRLEVFAARQGALSRLGETVVGLEPVAVVLRSESEAYVVNHLSDSVSVVDLSDPRRPLVKATLPVGDEPRDVVIGGPERDRVFITAARRGQNRPGDPALTTPGIGRAEVWVFSAGDLSSPPRLLTLFCDVPRALAVSPDGRRVYAAAFLSGNRTTVLKSAA
jgi:YVTN family beta-propeller protein